MTRKVCATCPFIKGVKMAYDEDAMEALDSGMVPSCHAIVGTQAIFHDECPGPDTVCLGHERWVAGDKGFDIPKELAGESREEA